MIREQQTQVPAAGNPLFCRARILYMEDDLGLGFLLKKRLERLACIVDLARDGKEGLEMLTGNTYSVVIADYNMPQINGLDILKAVKGFAPVIILTGQGDERIAVEAMKLGAADYMTKDINGEYLEILPSIIDRVMERQELLKERRQARAELEASEARYRAIVEDQTELICRFATDGRLSFANEAFCRYFDIRQTDIVFQSLDMIVSRKVYQSMKRTFKTLSPQNPSAMSTHEIKMLDGKVHWLQWTQRAVFVAAGELKEYQLVGRDITELKQTEKALRESEEKNNALLNAIPDSILRLNRQGLCLDLRFKKGQALNMPADFSGKKIADLFAPEVATQLMAAIDRVFAAGESPIFHFTVKQGQKASDQEVRVFSAGADEVLVVLRDITEHNKLERRLQYLSNHDSLTDLYNRTYFEDALQQLASDPYHAAGIVVCDVDELKTVNDNLGSKAGDQLLKAAASIIGKAFRTLDLPARIGGDKFAVLLPGATAMTVEQACKRLKAMVAEYNAARPEFFLSISVGAASSERCSLSANELFKQADTAMYHDKLSKREIVHDAMG